MGRRLLAPGGHHAGRGDHEERVVGPAADDGVLHEREHLQRLAQPHVVGQDPAEAVLVEEGQPPEALQLVGPQRGGRGRPGRAGGSR